MQERYHVPEERLQMQALRSAIPFLKQIPDSVFFSLDPSEFYLPIGEVANSRAILEETLQHHIMTYRRDVFTLSIPVNRHLCANIKGAHLTEAQLLLLQQEEKRLKDNRVSFVAYQNPLELIDPYESDLALYYREYGLL